MKKFATFMCCAGMAILGYTIASTEIQSDKHLSLYAATVPDKNVSAPILPLDLVLDQAKRFKTDTVYVEIHDTVIVNNIKYVRVPVPEHTTDTIYVPLGELPEIEVMPVKNKSPGESFSDSTANESKPIVVLTIDGKIVYMSEKDSISVYDGLK